MTSEQMPIDSWLDQLADVAKEVAASTLSTEAFEIRDRTHGIPKELAGSWIAMVGDECSAQVGICSNQSGAKRLAGMMLGMGPDEELDDEGTADAVCELINVMAGVLKSRVSAQMAHFKLGIPVFFQGSLSVSGGTEAGSLQVCIDSIPVHLLVLKPKTT